MTYGEYIKKIMNAIETKCLSGIDLIDKSQQDIVSLNLSGKGFTIHNKDGSLIRNVSEDFVINTFFHFEINTKKMKERSGYIKELYIDNEYSGVSDIVSYRELVKIMESVIDEDERNLIFPDNIIDLKRYKLDKILSSIKNVNILCTHLSSLKGKKLDEFKDKYEEEARMIERMYSVEIKLNKYMYKFFLEMAKKGYEIDMDSLCNFDLFYQVVSFKNIMDMVEQNTSIKRKSNDGEEKTIFGLPDISYTSELKLKLN